MRTFKRNLMIGLMIILAAFGIFAGCGEEDNGRVTVSFETNGGQAIESVVLDVGQEYTLPTPVYKAHSFEGWFDNSELSGTAVTSIVAEGDVTFYAKWEEMYPVNLELNGGSLAETELYLKAGENVYDFMKDRVPVLDADHTFGAWFNGDKELSAGTVMTSAGITLKAKYKVKFTVQPYLETDDGYSEADPFTGYGYEGTEPEIALEGYDADFGHEGSDSLRALAPNAADNKFTVYFNRKVLTVTLIPNDPFGQMELITLTLPYGKVVDLPADLTVAGYCLMGWGTSLTGGVTYRSTYFYDHLYEKGEEQRPEGFTARESVTLYAIWERGYTDMFGGTDTVYRFGENDDEIYICRDNVFFRAELNSSGEFIIRNQSEEIVQRGIFCDADQFIYQDATRARIYYLYEHRTSNRDVRLQLNEYNGVTYSRPSGDGEHTDTSSGTYVLEEIGGTQFCVSTFTSGSLQGQTLTILVGYILDEQNERVNSFQIRADEDVELGTLYRFVDATRYYPEVYLVTLNGLGTATRSAGSTTENYYYEREGDTVTLYTSQNTVAYELRLATMGGMNGYYQYEEALDHTFVSSDGATFKPDGIYSAVYNDGTSPVEGSYLVTTSYLGGSIVDFTYGEETKRFRLTVVSPEEDGGETSYVLTELTSTYTELLYAGDGGQVYYIPLLVLDDGGEGKAALYGYPGVRTYTKFAEGTYLYNEEQGLYTFTLTDYIETENMTTGFAFDCSELTAFVFGTLYSSSYSAYYVYSVSLGEQDPTEYNEIYRSGEDTLTLVAGFCFYKTAAGTVIGLYTREGNVLSFTAGEEAYLFELDPEEGKFELLTQLRGTAYAMTVSGSDRTKSLTFDGKGGAVYSDTASGDTVNGSYREAEGKTILGDSYFVFVPEGEGQGFEFMLYSSGSTVLFVQRNSSIEGDYLSASQESLVLDGFAKAHYVSSSEDLTGTYVYNEELGMIRVTVGDSSYLFIDLQGNNTFSRRGMEYTDMCLYFDNQTLIEDVYFGLDGYGKLTAYDASGSVIDEEGTYRNLEGNRYLFTYKGADGKKVEIYGVFGVASIGGSSYLSIIREHDGVAGVYVNGADMTVLDLDAYGDAVRYSAMGVAQSGRYLLVTDTLLYYYTDSDACIYRFNVERGSATPAKFTPYGYYTKDLEALNFSEYGYVYLEGERCYFTLDGDNVIIYRAPREGETEVNAYGFVEDTTFGTFSAEKSYNGKNYYRSDGYSITFTRVEENASLYPILTQLAASEEDEDVYSPLGNLTFSPVGDGEFTVSGLVTIGDLGNRTCTIVREVLDDGSVELYLSVPANLGYYRFDLTVDYHGDSAGPNVNVYSIDAMKYVIALPSYNYLYYNFLINMMSGGTMAMANVFGELVITKNCDEQGKITDEAYLDFTLGEALSITDYEGNVFELDQVEFEENTSGYINYTVEWTGKDGYTYIFRFARTMFQYTRQYGFNIYSITRLQTYEVELGEGKTGKVEVERVIYSELTGISPGDIYAVRLYNEQEELLQSESYSYLRDGVVTYIVRQTEEEHITSTTYYYINLEEKLLTDVDDPHTGRVPPYEGASVTSETMRTLYSKEGDAYADINSEGEIVLFIIGRTVYLVDTCTYDEGTKTYDLTTTGGRHYHVTEGDEGLTFEEITEPAE